MARTTRAILAFLLLLALAPVSLGQSRAERGEAAARSNEELRRLRGRIERLEKELAAAERTRGGALEELRALEKGVSDAHRTLFELDERRRGLEAELEEVRKREREARSSLAAEESLAERLLRLQHRHGSVDRLRLILEGRDAATAARHLIYYGYIQRMRADLIVALREKAVHLEALAGEARARRVALEENESDLVREARRLENERAARTAAVKRLAGEIDRGQREIGRLKRDEGRLARLVEEIARELASRPAPSPKSAGRKVDRVADASAAAKPFESLKGKLRLPAKGELVNRFGAPREETGATWKGLFIRSITGETVHAVADGRVVYADWLRGFGNLLILDHGGGYMSLYANNEGLVRQVGENVRGGDPIARVGASGGHAESGVYFELRRDGKPFDPLRWVTL